MDIEHDRGESRFVARLEHGDAELAYAESETRVLDLNHTYVPPEHRGRGVAHVLVERAFEFAEENGMRIRPSCPYVRAWVQKHPERKGLVVADG